VSDADGNFEFPSLEPGLYRFTIVREGFMASPVVRDLKPSERVEQSLLASWVPWQPPLEVFAGVSGAFRNDGNRTAAFGWQASVSLPRLAGLDTAFDELGILLDLGGQYKDGGSAHQFLAGPQFRVHASRVWLALHALAGVERSTMASSPGTVLLMGYGGGLSMRLSRNAMFRVVEFDWLPSRRAGNWSFTDIRYGFGMVFAIGPLYR
jgi:hypothetical protein